MKESAPLVGACSKRLLGIALFIPCFVAAAEDLSSNHIEQAPQLLAFLRRWVGIGRDRGMLGPSEFGVNHRAHAHGGIRELGPRSVSHYKKRIVKL
jgi:hypothetical protein